MRRHIPVSISIAVALHTVFVLFRFVLPVDWWASGRYFLISNGIATCGTLLVAMGLGELALRLPERQAAGARMAMIAYATLAVLSLTSGLVDLISSEMLHHSDTVWKVESYIYFAVYLTAGAGVLLAANAFQRALPLAIVFLVLIVLSVPPAFLGEKLSELFGGKYRYIYVALRVAYLALLFVLAQQAAQSSTRDLPSEPTAPLALMGSALRTRLVAMCVLVMFTVFAMGGRNLAMMKVALVLAPLITIASFMVFAVGALQAGRASGEPKHTVPFAFAGGAAAWCAGVTSLQTPSMFSMLSRSDSYMAERSREMATALSIVLPLVAILSVVIALAAVGSFVRDKGHAVADSIASRTTAFVLLMLGSVLLQQYAVPKARSVNELLVLSVLATIAGVVALVVAANTFKRAADATSTHALPTATVLP